jgi:hypothetical protein
MARLLAGELTYNETSQEVSREDDFRQVKRIRRAHGASMPEQAPIQRFASP